MKRPVLLFPLLLLLGVSAFAQKPKPDVCNVGLVDYSGKGAAIESTLPIKQLGTFEPVLGEEERTVRAFRIPRTRLFAVAAVYYTDESMRLENNFYSVSLELAVSASSRRDPFNSLQYAEAEAMSVTPNIARVSTFMKIQGHPTMILMECRREVSH